jgi:hypothetical protein
VLSLLSFSSFAGSEGFGFVMARLFATALPRSRTIVDDDDVVCRKEKIRYLMSFRRI